MASGAHDKKWAPVDIEHCFTVFSSSMDDTSALPSSFP